MLLKLYDFFKNHWYIPGFHISEPKFPTKISKALYSIAVYGISELTIQYDRNTAYSAEKSVLGQTIQNSF